MAVIPFAVQDMKIEGTVLRAEGLATGDSTSVININDANVDITVQITGTVGGSTVAVVGALVGSVFSTVDDAFGQPMSYTAIGVIKPIGPAITQLKMTVTGGSGVDVDVDVYIVRRVRGA
jgi:hypothetical protein